MRQEDVNELVVWLRKAQAGRRLVPQRSYRDFRFGPPPEDSEPQGLQQFPTSRDW